MTTWILWCHLLHPPDHPLFYRTLKTPVKSWDKPQMLWGVALLVSPLVCCGIWSLVARFHSMPVLWLMTIVVFSSACVVRWAASISVTIAREHERRTYDPLCLLPGGALGANWAICTACLHRSDVLGWFDLLRKLLTGMLLIVLLTALVTTVFQTAAAEPLQFVWLLLDMIALVAVSYAEHVQSIVLGSLVGMLVPVYIQIRAEARVWAVATFLMLQAFSFLSAFLTETVIYPEMFRALGDVGLSSTLLSLLVFYLVREGCIVTLWGLLAYHLDRGVVTPKSWTQKWLCLF